MGCLGLLLFLFVAGVKGSTFDGTLQRDARGTDVVQATVNKIDDSCIFEDDKLLLRRLAHVETTDGKDSYGQDSGGMWQVSSDALAETQASSLLDIHQQISTQFGITWSTVTHDDLNIPLHSALAARLRIQIQTGSDIPRSVEDQADYWANDYNENDVDKQTYIDKVNSLNDGCSIPQADLVFVMDGSGSVHNNDFKLTLQFVESIIQSLVAEDHSSYYVRVGVIQYSGTVRVELELDKHDKQYAIDTVKSITQIGAGTASHLALQEMKSMFVTNQREEGAVPQIGIFFTDGQSNDPALTVAAAEDVHNSTAIEMFAIGIGPSVYADEMIVIASEPICTHFHLLQDFESMVHFEAQLVRATCNSHTEMEEGEDTVGEIPPNESVYFRLTVTSDGGGVTVNVKTETGSADLYASYTARNPSSVVYDYKASVDSSMGDGISLGIPYVEESQGRRRRQATEGKERPVYLALASTDEQQSTNFRMAYEEGYSSAAGVGLSALVLGASMLASLLQ